MVKRSQFNAEIRGYSFIDYGYSRQEYYAEERKNGSMICHYRNTAHENPS
ncbi:MAG: hypothetical protein Ct9H300mP6_07030 [Gammaproteobacteria bacterium]|nr:MAG: hypothetical protein Ct9H300mP6_07030 [Gammaproteobacteria bacterium]